MDFDSTAYLAIAEIAGVFVGFGALIGVAGFSGGKHLDFLGPVVTNGLLVIFSALLPVGLSYYSLEADWLWRICAIAVLLTSWVATLIGISNKKMSARTLEHVKASPLFSLALIALEAMVQIPLLLCVIGFYPELREAFYMTSILVNLMQASLFMVKLVIDAMEEG